MKLLLTKSDVFAMGHVLNGMRNLSMEGAYHLRDIRQVLHLDELPEDLTLAQAKKETGEVEYELEKARVEWVLQGIKAGYAAGSVHPLVSDVVLTLYEKLEKANAPK